MAFKPASPTRTVRLDFRHHDELAHVHEAIRLELSALSLHGRSLWLSNDELATVERLLLQDDGSFGEHRFFALADMFDLPEGAEGRMDIEGLEVDPIGPWLWVVGSHSRTRAKAIPGRHETGEAFARLTDIRRERNRHFLGRIPLVAVDRRGTFELREEAPDLGSAGVRRAACLESVASLDALLADDPHIGPFMAIPAKENGFDVEGVVARGERVFVGLRGPVLGRWAVLVELVVEETGPGRLAPRPLGEGGVRYRKHFMDLCGLGMRDFAVDGDSLLILAGPSMDLDGPQIVFRWPGWLEARSDSVVPADQLERMLVVPHGEGTDHAEGISLIEIGRGKELLVVYDCPDPKRLPEDQTSIDADAFAFDF
jgi:hypothetical protein